MSDPMGSIPPALREAIRRDLQPVRPLLPPRSRVAAVVFAGAVAALFLLMTFGVRHDMPEIPPLAFWIPLLLRLAIGIILVAFALREAVPGEGASRPVRLTALAIALILLFAMPLVFAEVVGSGGVSPPGEDLFCYQLQMTIGGPAFLLAWFLVARGFPLRPLFAMLAAGFGAGLLADGAMFAVCNLHGERHWLIAHSGAVLTFAMLGAVAGAITSAVRLRRAAE